MVKGCFDVQKKASLERDYRFFVAVLSEMDLGNVDTRGVKAFVGTTLECVVTRFILKSTSLNGLEMVIKERYNSYLEIYIIKCCRDTLK